MAEVKNAFIKSKMNKDLDSRLVPQGEYRDAVNIQVSKSEGDDVGALENVLGKEEAKKALNRWMSTGLHTATFEMNRYSLSRCCRVRLDFSSSVNANSRKPCSYPLHSP